MADEPVQNGQPQYPANWSTMTRAERRQWELKNREKVARNATAAPPAAPPEARPEQLQGEQLPARGGQHESSDRRVTADAEAEAGGLSPDDALYDLAAAIARHATAVRIRELLPALLRTVADLIDAEAR